MIDLFGAVRGLLKVDDVTIDNCVFKLHYKATVVLLTACSLIVTARQYIGDPIDCIMDSLPSNIADTYCWITATYTLPSRLDGRVGADVIHPGVAGPRDDYDYDGDGDGDDRQVKYHKYYQWVCFVLFFQAVFFYVPRALWKTCEGGRVRSLAAHLRGLMSDEARADRVGLVAGYFADHMDALNAYAVRFFTCELLNLVNVVCQLWFLDYFLDGEFSMYGLETLQFGLYNRENRTDPMDRIFPKVTMCTFHKYGPSGSIQKLEGLCVLPVNIVNEKIFVFFWFWFWFVAVLSVANVLYRAAVLSQPGLRLLLLRAKMRLSARGHTMTVMSKTQIGSWFLLHQLGKNVDTVVFRELVVKLSHRLREMDETLSM